MYIESYLFTQGSIIVKTYTTTAWEPSIYAHTSKIFYSWWTVIVEADRQNNTACSSAEIKLLEVWKSIHVEGCPTELEPYYSPQTRNEHHLRPKCDRIFNDTTRLVMSQSSYNIDAARVWNNAPEKIRSAASISLAKNFIKEHCKLLPI